MRRPISALLRLALAAAALPALLADDGAAGAATTTPPSWGKAFSVAYQATAAQPLGTLALPIRYVDGQWHYHAQARRQRLQYTVLPSEDENDDGTETGGESAVELAEPTTIVELWRGHDEVYVFAPKHQACALVDWPYEPLPADWPRAGGGLRYRGGAYDVLRAANGTETLVQADIWSTTAEAAAGVNAAAVPTLVHFLRRDAHAGAAPDVPLRLMARAFPEAAAGVRAFFFSDFDGAVPPEEVFAVPAYCRNLTVVATDQAAASSWPLAVAGDPASLHSTFLSRATLLPQAPPQEQEQQQA